jgi:hypothetical protein
MSQITHLLIIFNRIRERVAQMIYRNNISNISKFIFLGFHSFASWLMAIGFLLPLAFCLLPFASSSQMIDNSQSNAFTDEPFFNTDFIKRNKIKSFTGKVSKKRDLQPIVDQGIEYYYEFDSEGRTTMILSTFNSFNHKDSLIKTFEYDEKGRITAKRTNDSYGFYSYNYKYDSLGRIIEESYCRDENCGPSRFQFKLGQQFSISTEKYSYIEKSKQESIREYKNYAGNVYQEKIFMKNYLGFLTEEITRITLNGRETKIVYEYDEKGRMSKKTDISEFMGKTEITNAFQYDDFGNLTEEQIYRNEKLTTMRSMIYDKMSGLLTALVAKDMTSEVITIVKYGYEFY